jgi:hypothetical protein
MRFSLASHANDTPHRFEVYDCTASGEQLVSELSDDVRSLYLAEQFDEVLEEAARDLDAVSDPAAIRQLVESAAQSTIPAPAQRTSQPWLDTARNELGEVICYAALEEIFSAILPAKRVRHKEIATLMSRGLDALGLGRDEQAPHGLRIYLSETKASSSEESPPPVVDQTPDCLHVQLLDAIQRRERVTFELARALKYTDGSDRTLVARAIVLWAIGDLATTIVPFLLRPRDKHGSEDFGVFRTDPSAYDPAQVAFCVVRIDSTIEGLAQAVYERART